MIPWAKPEFWGKEQEYITQALTSTWISGGEFVDRFEHEFATYCGVPYALTSSNGTTAIHMAYLALGIGPGDEVIIPGFGFLAAANIAIQMGAKPVFSEVDPTTWCITAAEIEKCLSPHTKVIVPIHTLGNVCLMDEIISLAETLKIPIIEDAAEAFTSRYKNRLAGTMGTIGTFSFQATKIITTGEGGMVITEDKELYDDMWLYRNHGMLRKQYYWHELAGYNFRLTNLQAALGCAQMEKLPQIVQERKRVHKCYVKHLSKISGLSLQQFLPVVDPVIWAIAVKLDLDAYPQGRDAVIVGMKELGIETRPGFYTPSLQKHLYDCPPLPICEEISRQVISLPTYPTLDDEHIEQICTKLNSLRK